MRTRILAIVIATACARAPQTSSSPVRALPGAPGDAISGAEMLRLPTGSLYEAVARLRPAYLIGVHRSATEANSTMPAVVVEGGFPEPLDALRHIDAGAVVRVNFLNASDATARYGPEFTAGIIIVCLQHARPPVVPKCSGCCP